MDRETLIQVAKPILFNTEMVRAIMKGRKKVTRRVIKPQPEGQLSYIIAGSECGKWYVHPKFDKYWTPPYHAGDILYVRETWRKHSPGTNLFIYRADYPDEYHKKIGFKPSIHMPKEAARIFLKVKSVTVEQLQEMTEEQAWKEGMLSECAECPDHKTDECKDCANQHEAYFNFSPLWDSTIKEQDLNQYGWNANPWVWVIQFERMEVEE